MSNDIRKAHKSTHNFSVSSPVVDNPISSPVVDNSNLNLSVNPYNGLPSNSLDLINGLTDKNLQNEYLYNYYGVVDQRDFAERMARNSYQYAVEDMRKAGLNPYLMYTNGGSGAVVPSTTSYSSNGYASAIQTAASTRYKADLDYKASVYKTDKEFTASLIRSFSNLTGDIVKVASMK